jgi:hypothetical protein
MRHNMKNRYKWFLVLILFWGFIFVGILNYWYYRPNTSFINRGLVLEDWDAVADGEHNSNTDMIYWNGMFYLAYAASPSHWGTSASRLVIRRSADAINWEKVVELRFEGKDIRDPKFANITGKLHLYALQNEGIIAAPTKTLYSVSTDGSTWADWKSLNGIEDGWLFWRPKQHANGTWFCPAYWNEHGKSALFRSNDGVNWSKVSTIFEGDSNDETAIEFLSDGRLIATARLEGFSPYSIIGDAIASTLITVSADPYTTWENITKSPTTRLDGPYLFSYNNKTYAVGRYEPEARGTFSQLGSFFNKKRTSIFRLKEDELIYLSDLPSAGDTAYAGVVQKDGYAYISYYTSDITRDFIWLMGQLSPCDVRIAKIKLSNLESVGKSPPNIPPPSPLKLDSMLLSFGIVGMAFIIFIAVRRWKESKKSLRK